ncbi:MAG: ribonuclease E/G [Paracoccaceae bacterium]|nr:ribonuclease E/G [Paracoccaceae bacterium]
MKGRVIVLDQPEDRGFAAALVVDGRLEDLLLDPKNGDRRPMAGDICVVRVARKLPKSGAFCEMISGEGYLRDARGVREGELILAQVQSLPEPGKAVTLTTRVLYKGPRVILTPGAPGVNVSKKIGNASERERLQAAVKARFDGEALPAGIPGRADGMGAIVRTEARGAAPEQLAREIDVLFGRQSNMLALLNVRRELFNGFPGSSYNLALRDWLLPVAEAVVMPPALAKIVTKRHGREDLGPFDFYGDERFIPLVQPDPAPFDAFGIWDEIERLKSPEIALGDASMVIEPTRALVAVDVNTGADFSPAAGLKTNLAVARELPRQLRLRGLGGKIAVDFAPMPKQNRRTLEEALAKAFRADPVETALVGWTALGLFEMQRKRERWPLMELL